MELVMFALALALLLLTGSGVAGLLIPRGRAISVVELLSLAVLLGAAVVSWASFYLGLLLSGTSLRLTVTAIGCGLGVIGVARWRRAVIKLSWPRPARAVDWLLCGLLLTEVSAIIWLSLRTPFGWDGLFNWESKAHLACVNGGVIPLTYFSHPLYSEFHTEYPLWLPLTEAWFYGWLGQCHQGLVKLFFAILYLAAVSLLWVSGARIGKRRLQAWLPALLLFFIPLVVFKDGSVASGLADFPLAVCYLAAVIYLAEYWETAAVDALRLVAGLSAVLPWIKQEGAVLWLCLMALVAIKAVPRRQVRALLLVMLPGAVMLGGWMIFVRVIKAPLGQDFMPLSFSTLWANRGRAPVIAGAVLRELVNWRYWGLLWPGLLLAVPLLKTRARPQIAALFLAVILPMICYLGPYFFFTVGGLSLQDHLSVSLQRLWLQVSLVAVLLVGMAIPAREDQV